MNIALIGHSCTGKTTICRLLAGTLNKKLISTDWEIEKKTKLSMEKFVEKHGWGKFHDVESDVIENISDFDECIFDTGSTAVMRNENIISLKRTSLIVLLTADIKTMASRMSKINKSQIKTNYPSEIKETWQEQEPRCKKAADYTIDTSMLSPEEACDLITHYVKMELQ